MSGLSLVTGPASEPVTLGDAIDHLRVTSQEELGRVAGCLLAARQAVEAWLGRCLMTTTYDARFDWCFPCTIELPRPPLQSVTQIQYVDTSGATQTLSSSLYQVSLGDIVGKVVRAYGATWPTPRRQIDAIIVRFVAGYASLSDVPEPIRQAILLMTSHLFDNRQPIIEGVRLADLPFSVTALLAPYQARF
jgi:uncharacterized phiE125 gp8 family phage protein